MTAQVKLIGNIQAAIGELLTDTLAERRRNYSSTKEVWAELKDRLESIESLTKQMQTLHKDLWQAAKTNNDDAFSAYADELCRVCTQQAVSLLNMAVVTKIEVE